MPKKTTQKNKKMPSGFNPRKIKYDKRDIIALILALTAVSFLILNAIYFLGEQQDILKILIVEDPEVLEILPVFFTIFSILWIILAILMSFMIYKIEKKKMKWHSLLTISIVSLFAIRPDVAVLGIISSILYRKNHK